MISYALDNHQHIMSSEEREKERAKLVISYALDNRQHIQWSSEERERKGEQSW